MSAPRRELRGDPEAMRHFAEQVTGPSVSESVVVPPSTQPCQGGMHACAVFTAADLASTMALARFLSETGADIAALKSTAAVAAADYLATDLAGAQAVAGPALGFVIAEE
ncbi:hypothetical protein [Amycolatopsis nigrescens]|uniref:hypothetical protein n=1 Tax=Amycolatopsis nigrescens TaxID=381445 RepID=UPI00037163BE|nr:hypothetical protein [Amycolatopsis nigrescens]